MSREWKPGSVVRLSPDDDRTDGTLRSAIGVVVDEPGRGRKWLHWFYCDGRDAGEHGSLVEPSLVRPLVVIDPDDRAAVERLADAFDGALRQADPAYYERAESYESDGDDTDILQAALREYASPKPPRPDEPQGLGAVVEDEDGYLYVRGYVNGESTHEWHVIDPASNKRMGWWKYDEIAAVRVLSAGVEVSA